MPLFTVQLFVVGAGAVHFLPRCHTTPTSEFSPVRGKKFTVPIFEVTRFQCALGDSEADQRGLN